MAKPTKQFEQYGLLWSVGTHPLLIEKHMIRKWGRYKLKDGTEVGNGMFFHCKRFQQLLHPEKVWHRWNELLLQNFIDFRIIGVMGPASCGKSREACDFSRMIYYCWPECTTVICSSTEKETLEDRIWGEIKGLHREARERFDFIPGQMIESRLRIVTDERQSGEDANGRDFRNGLVGVPCKKGGSYVGLGAYSGRKNKIVILVADEGQFMPKVYVDAISNLGKNEIFWAIVLGNPKETTDALGLICQPAYHLGGWDGGIDQQPGTKTWETKWKRGICVQLMGMDSPNLDGKLGIPLITKEQMDADAHAYGKDSCQFTMMNEGRMPRGQGSRRIITEQMCHQNHAMDKAKWAGTKRTRVYACDPAYGGGDRCVGGWLEFGPGLDGRDILRIEPPEIIPVSVKLETEEEDQIAQHIKMRLDELGIPAQNAGYDSFGSGTLGFAFGKVFGADAPVPIDSGSRPTTRPVRFDLFVNIDGTPWVDKSKPHRLKRCDEHYSKFVTEMWFSTTEIIKGGQLRELPLDVMREGCSREYTTVMGNKLEAEKKELTKLRLGCSPDLYDWFAIGVEMCRRKGFRILRLGVPVVQEVEEESPLASWDDQQAILESKLLTHA